MGLMRLVLLSVFVAIGLAAASSTRAAEIPRSSRLYSQLLPTFRDFYSILVEVRAV